MDDLEEAVVSVLAGHVARVCVPGRWAVWRDGAEAKVEIKLRVAKQ